MGTTHPFQPVTAADYRRLAEKRLPRFLFDYIDGGANEELTLAANEAAFRRVRIRQRVMRDVSDIDTATTLAGEAAALPLALGPVGMAGLMARRGEAQAVHVAQTAGVPFTLSTVGTCSLAEVRAASRRPFWFQLYMLRDRAAVQAMLEGARAAGCTTLVFTVDLAVPGLRNRDVRNGMVSGTLRGRLAKAWQLGLRPRWLVDVGLRGRPHGFGSLSGLVSAPTDLNAFRAWLEGQFDPSVTWKDIQWLRDQWPGKLILKGMLEADDARAAVDAGADGVVVSNHGGRQLDGVSPALAKLPAVARAVGAAVEVYVDGGVRSGLDVFKARALGARGVLIGRPWVWALAGAGPAGLADLLARMQLELKVAMALSGVRRIDGIGPEAIEATDGFAEAGWPSP